MNGIPMPALEKILVDVYCDKSLFGLAPMESGLRRILIAKFLQFHQPLAADLSSSASLPAPFPSNSEVKWNSTFG
jgi:hypothetical protein